ncbi:GNAT family N-acetyltransferase [Streptomyces sp. NPDC005322]|uniref:GNAT family N-acetyltransferase n=1 Tax=Streptomyces sp. NPDC005322 TaxID=3157032 RepID=UPI0033A11671
MRTLIETARLQLQCFQPGDTAELHEIFSDPRTNTIGTGPFVEVGQTADWIGRRVRAVQESGLVWYGLRLRDTGLLVGNCGVFAGRTGAVEPEVGYMIRSGHRGKGIAGEAAQAVLEECFSTGIRQVWATIRPGNAASLRVAARLGMVTQYIRKDERGELLYLSVAYRADQG